MVYVGIVSHEHLHETCVPRMSSECRPYDMVFQSQISYHGIKSKE